MPRDNALFQNADQQSHEPPGFDPFAQYKWWRGTIGTVQPGWVESEFRNRRVTMMPLPRFCCGETAMINRTLVKTVFTWCCLVPAANSVAADWLQFRGPGGQGHSAATGLPVDWNEEQNIAWKVEVPGHGWSSPVTSAGRIYLTAAVPDGEEASKTLSLRTICLDAATGRIEWNVEVFEQSGVDVEKHSKNSHASPTPVVDDGHIYVHFGPYVTACLDTAGAIVWKNHDLQYAPNHGNGGSPALAGDILVVCCDGRDKRFVAGIHRSTGKLAWRTERELAPAKGFSFSTPAIIEWEGRQQAICPGSGGVWSYDPVSGKQLWRVAYGEGFSVVPRPIFAHGLVFVCSGFGDGHLFAIDPSGSGDVTDSHVRWKTKKGVPRSPSLLAVAHELYMVDDGGVVTCVDAVSGNVHWKERLAGGFSASPLLADGHIYILNETGETTVIQPGVEYEQVAQNRLGDGKTRTFASFAIVDNAILLRSETHLYRIQKL